MEELNKKIVALYQEMGRSQGLRDSLLTEIFARLYIEPEPIPMEKLAKVTGYSLASVSNKVKMLAPMLQIKKSRKPGSKKLFLYAEKDVLKMWRDALVMKDEYVIKKIKDALPSIIREFKNKAKTENDKKKLRILEEYHKQMLKLEVIIKETIKKFEEMGV